MIMVVLMADLLTPFFIWKGILPPPIRWISSIGVAILASIAFARMMALDRIPRAVLVIGALSAIGITVALLEGQGILATAWGWWRMFEFVLVGLFAYLSPHWPPRFPHRLLAFCVGVLGMEVLFQIGQYLTGQPIGDHLAGTFGRHGVGPLAIFIMFVLCLGLGQWLSEGRWKILLIAITLGLISSVLGEIKIFTAAALALSMLAALFFVLRRGQLRKLIPFALLAGIVLWIFAAGYNTFASRSNRPLLQQVYLDSTRRNSYLNLVRQSATEPDSFDIAIANISAKVILEAAGELARAVKSGGKVIVSGILLDNKAGVEQAMASVGATLDETLVDGDWVALVYSMP
ncbi:MAG: 50S ribosomal protein L11 methyltransferase [Chloroflexi bacterium]|nr:50S ribosomal protein L11 methyltransferase [Chloroflexota bacterium]